MPETLVTIATFNIAPQAHLAKARLAEEGIEAFVIDEHLNYLLSHLTLAFGGVKLQVRDRYAEEAIAVLQRPIDWGDIESEFVAHNSESTPKHDNANTELRRCPECSSTDIRHKWLYSLSIPLGLLCGTPIPKPKSKWICTNCGHKWEAE